jgi:hypothetical protein
MAVERRGRHRGHGDRLDGRRLGRVGPARLGGEAQPQRKRTVSGIEGDVRRR